MKNVFIIADNIFSPLGSNSAVNFGQLIQNIRGVKKHEAGPISPLSFYASLFEAGSFEDKGPFTKFEQLLQGSISDVLSASAVDPSSPKTLLIISTTKGNISMVEHAQPGDDITERISLHHSAKLLAKHFGFVNPPLVVSNACISGLLAMITGMRLIQAGTYDQVVVAGADAISRFVLSGFQSFQAVSNAPCRPFDAARDGINLGEGAAAVVLSSQQRNSNDIRITGGSVSNDANHISGPSRTGEELSFSISKAMKEAGLSAKDIGFISAHGTATVYNDEMESRAITIAGLNEVPLNSLKGFYGHTLGAAGLIEAVASIHSMQQGLILPTPGFSQIGVSQPVNICSSLQKTAVNHCLKTASGFGGCNAAIVLSQA